MLGTTWGTLTRENSGKLEEVSCGNATEEIVRGEGMKDEDFIEFVGDYISVVATGSDSYARGMTLWKSIAAACEQYDCYNILGQSRTVGELSTMDSFKHIEIFQEAGITWKHRIAWVAVDPDKFEQLKFIETVLRNRSLVNGGLFRTVEEARNWLQGDGTAEDIAGKSPESSKCSKGY